MYRAGPSKLESSKLGLGFFKSTSRPKIGAIGGFEKAGKQGAGRRRFFLLLLLPSYFALLLPSVKGEKAGGECGRREQHAATPTAELRMHNATATGSASHPLRPSMRRHESFTSPNRVLL
jgi:hypothetical protein